MRMHCLDLGELCFSTEFLASNSWYDFFFLIQVAPAKVTSEAKKLTPAKNVAAKKKAEPSSDEETDSSDDSDTEEEEVC